MTEEVLSEKVKGDELYERVLDGEKGSFEALLRFERETLTTAYSRKMAGEHPGYYTALHLGWDEVPHFSGPLLVGKWRPLLDGFSDEEQEAAAVTLEELAQKAALFFAEGSTEQKCLDALPEHVATESLRAYYVSLLEIEGGGENSAWRLGPKFLFPSWSRFLRLIGLNTPDKRVLWAPHLKTAQNLLYGLLQRYTAGSIVAYFHGLKPLTRLGAGASQNNLSVGLQALQVFSDHLFRIAHRLLDPLPETFEVET